ncbi:MAG TPA: hypothetical protein VMV07_18095 [Streptosporangiaceae bacterium]|nr:hypothetical protein [Streptosporangiaceae bacterium]
MTKRFWGAIGVVAALIVAAGAFLAWGPLGIGAGPLAVAFVASSGTVPQSRPSVLLVPIETGAATPAVIDSVRISGGQGYPAPRLLSVVGDPDQACSGIWWPLTGENSFAQRCAKGGTVPLVGRVIPVGHLTLAAHGRRPAATRTIDVSIEVAAPGSAGCWNVTEVVVRYHVGSRHYTTTADEALSGCTNAVELTPSGRATVPPTATPTVAQPTP